MMVLFVIDELFLIERLFSPSVVLNKPNQQHRTKNNSIDAE